MSNVRCVTRTSSGFHVDPDTGRGYGFVDWNESKTKLVAIDGQHRLTALKRLKADNDHAQEGGLGDWRIPVVILGFRSTGATDDEPGSLLEAVRRIFVHINREAKQPSRARTILLTDESVNAIATQELLQRSHSNDVLPAPERDPEILPLLFYDWRGEEVGGKPLPAPAAVKSAEEIHDWIADLILGPDFSDDQGFSLGIEATSDLKYIYAEGQLPPRLTPQLASSCGQIWSQGYRTCWSASFLMRPTVIASVP